MKKKYVAVAILAMLVPAFALPVMALEIAPSKPYIYPPQPEPDWPDMLAFKGIAVKGDRIESIVFIGLERDNSNPFQFGQAYMIVDGQAKKVEITEIETHPEQGAVILRLGDDGFLVLKSYQQEYRGNIFVISGEWNEWNLNMRAVGLEDYVYIQWLQQSAVTQEPYAEPVAADIARIVEEIAK